MTDFQQIEKYCETEPRARRLALRDRAVLNFVLKEFSGIREAIKDIPKDKMIEFVSRTQTIARRFREVLESHPEWQTEEEKEAKVRLEQEYQLANGYSPLYKQETSKLKTL
jgi:hypothetical protein